MDMKCRGFNRVFIIQCDTAEREENVRQLVTYGCVCSVGVVHSRYNWPGQFAWIR